MKSAALKHPDFDEVQSLDLAPVAKTVSKKKLLKAKDLSTAEELYRAFLFLTKIYPNKEIVPHPMADVFWHAHILLTQKYHDDCERLFGQYLHHSPDDGSSKQKAAQRDTVKLLEKHFL